MFPALLTAIFFAGAAVSARQSSALIGPYRANLLRLLIAILILGTVATISWRDMPGNLEWFFIMAGGIGFGLGGFCMMLTLARMGSPRALLAVESLTAVLAGLLAWIFLDDTVSLQRLLFCAVILGGVLLAGSGWKASGQRDHVYSTGNYILAGSASLFQAVSLVVSRGAFLEASRLEGPVNPFNAAFLRLSGGLLIAGLLLLFALKSSGSLRGAHKSLIAIGRSLREQPLFWATTNALSGPVLGVTCWLWAVSIMNPGVVQSIAATAPLISVPLSRRLEWDQLGWRFYAGCPVAIAGIAALALWPA